MASDSFRRCSNRRRFTVPVTITWPASMAVTFVMGTNMRRRGGTSTTSPVRRGGLSDTQNDDGITHLSDLIARGRTAQACRRPKRGWCSPSWGSATVVAERSCRVDAERIGKGRCDVRRFLRHRPACPPPAPMWCGWVWPLSRSVADDRAARPSWPLRFGDASSEVASRGVVMALGGVRSVLDQAGDPATVIRVSSWLHFNVIPR